MQQHINKNKEQLEKERERLEYLLRILLGPGLADISESRMFGKREDIVTAYSDIEINTANIKKHQERLSEINRALRKIDEGSYGLCDICGGEIPSQRLTVLPQTNVCLACKQKAGSGGSALYKSG